MEFKEYIQGFSAVLRLIPQEQVLHCMHAIENAYTRDAHVFIFGNGGSGSNASHICEDLGKGTIVDFDNQKRLKVISLTDNTPYILAWANDTSYERIFVEQLKNLARSGDVVIGISGSGKSPNVLRAIEYANANGMHTIGLTGFDGGTLKSLAHKNVHIQSHNMGIVESAHLAIFHYIIDTLKQKFEILHARAST